jgi:hypothetical protein
MNKLHSIVPTLFISLLCNNGRTLGVGIGVHPPIIPWMTNVICVIVDPCSAFMVHLPRLDRHEVTVIVIGKEDRHFRSVSSKAMAYIPSSGTLSCIVSISYPQGILGLTPSAKYPWTSLYIALASAFQVRLFVADLPHL